MIDFTKLISAGVVTLALGMGGAMALDKVSVRHQLARPG
jgi:NitT/TauT family transport system substrate-binding protein